MSEQDIIGALVGNDGERVRLYQVNAWFKMGVDQLAAFLPALVEGLARQAEEKEASRAEGVASLMRASWPGRGII